MNNMHRHVSVAKANRWDKIESAWSIYNGSSSLHPVELQMQDRKSTPQFDKNEQSTLAYQG